MLLHQEWGLTRDEITRIGRLWFCKAILLISHELFAFNLPNTVIAG